MAKFWCVSQKYFDSGTVKVSVYSIEAETKPQNTQINNQMCDEYHDYFDTYEEAKQVEQEAKNA